MFRNEEDARAFQETTGVYPESEEFVPISMDRGEIAEVLKLCNLSWVALPRPWSGEGGVDSFTAEGFLRFLDSCPKV